MVSRAYRALLGVGKYAVVYAASFSDAAHIFRMRFAGPFVACRLPELDGTQVLGRMTTHTQPTRI